MIIDPQTEQTYKIRIEAKIEQLEPAKSDAEIADVQDRMKLALTIQRMISAFNVGNYERMKQRAAEIAAFDNFFPVR